MDLTDQKFSSDAAGEYGCSLLSSDGGVDIYRITMRWEKEAIPQAVTLRFTVPGTDTYSVFDCRRFDRAKHWGGDKRTSRLGGDFPLLQLISKTGGNRLLFTLSDVKTPTGIGVRCDSRDMTVPVEVAFFTELTSPMKEYSCDLRIDSRDVPFTEALDGAKRWFSDIGFSPAHTPDAAFDPVWSTWYAYLTEITAADVLRECGAAKELGMDTVIIDDGWQRQNGASVYGYCGDWEPWPGKFPDMAGLIERLHGMGMRVVLWYSVPYVGRFSGNYERFEGKYLTEVEGCDCSVLDPRFPEVREWVAGVYETAAKQWKPDGFKLDFIDRFRSNGKVAKGMDFTSVEDATFALLSEIHARLTAVDPDMLTEFRQPYCGPAIAAFGNMMRVWDCPNDGMTNRVASLTMRLTTDRAVHSDMIRWNRDETPEHAAVMLWGTLFGVPQISVRFEELTDAQRSVLRRYLSFWREHRDTLMKGRLEVQSPECMFPYASATLGGETVALCVAQNFADVSGNERAYICNLTGSDKLIVKIDRPARIAVKNCLGDTVSETAADKCLIELTVPPAGTAEIECKQPSALNTKRKYLTNG